MKKTKRVVLVPLHKLDEGVHKRAHRDTVVAELAKMRKLHAKQKQQQKRQLITAFKEVEDGDKGRLTFHEHHPVRPLSLTHLFHYCPKKDLPFGHWIIKTTFFANTTNLPFLNAPSLVELYSKHLGPFVVKKRNHAGASVFQDITGSVIPDRVPPSLLKKASPSSTLVEHLSEPPPVFDDHYEVEKVFDYDGLPNECYYLVCWKGYDEDS
ncbi:hypothetical protein QOT17_017927 [Balamuthia mandrillaris]